MDEKVGDAEPCDWCGRPGKVEQCDWWRGDVLEGRNPSLCSVCSFWFRASGDDIDALKDAGFDYDVVMATFEDELLRKWRDKVDRGERKAQAPGERDEMFRRAHRYPKSV